MNRIQAELKDLYSPDLDLRNPQIDHTKPFCVSVEAMFGDTKSDSSDSFFFQVCNPKWMAVEARKKIVSGAFCLIMHSFNLVELRRFFVDLANRCSGESWPDVAAKIGEYGRWEFESTNRDRVKR